jgi:integrase
METTASSTKVTKSGKSVNTTSKTGRDDILPRREPHWTRIQKGLYLGYRKLSAGEGTWIARHQTGTSKRYGALGHFDEPKAYDKAAKAAQGWLKAMEAGISTEPMTVTEACSSYVDHLKVTKGVRAAEDAKGRIKRLVDEATIGKVQIAKLTVTQVRAWLNKQIDIDADEEEVLRGKDTANRNLSALKAALNFAYKNQLIGSDAAWKPVTAFRDVGRRRKGFLTLAQRDSLVANCPADLANLVKAMLLTAARPGELVNLTVQDFDKAQGTIQLTGKTGTRVATLSTAAIKFFTELSKDRIGNAHMLANEFGTKWNKDQWKKPFKKAVAKAKLPTTTVMYTLRHVAITELVNNGMDSFLVAKLAGTSTAMIDKFYGEARHDKTREKLDRVAMVG